MAVGAAKALPYHSAQPFVIHKGEPGTGCRWVRLYQQIFCQASSPDIPRVQLPRSRKGRFSNESHFSCTDDYAFLYLRNPPMSYNVHRTFERRSLGTSRTAEPTRVSSTRWKMFPSATSSSPRLRDHLPCFPITLAWKPFVY